MKLSRKERAFLKELRKQERHNRIFRVFSLLIGILLAIATIIYPDRSVPVSSSGVMTFASIYFITSSFQYWHGVPQISLLLKLYDEVLEDNSLEHP